RASERSAVLDDNAAAGFPRACPGRPLAETLPNLRGLECPLPALRPRQAPNALAAGDVLLAACTDPLREIDIPHLARETGDAIEATDKRDDVVVFRIRRKLAEG